MNTFIDLLKSSVITQGLITTIVLIVWGILTINGKVIPPEVSTLVMLVVGFYFGSKIGMVQGINQQIGREVQNAREKVVSNNANN